MTYLYIPGTISEDGGVSTVSILVDSNIIVHDVDDNSHLFLTPDTHRMRRVADLDELEPSLCRVVHPHSNEAILPTGLLDPSDVELDLVL